jgi:excisionase family DNA binding protein
MIAKAVETTIQPVVLSISQAGAYLSVSPDTVRRLIRKGTIPHARIGNSIRIRRADLDGYLESQTSRQWQPVDNRGGGFTAHLAR